MDRGLTPEPTNYGKVNLALHSSAPVPAMPKHNHPTSTPGPFIVSQFWRICKFRVKNVQESM